MTIAIPAEMSDLFRAANVSTEVVAANGEYLGTFLRIDQSSWNAYLDRLPPGLVFDAGTEPPFDVDDLDDTDDDHPGDMTSEALWQHIESLSCTD